MKTFNFEINQVFSASVATKKDPRSKEVLSMGFGFITFKKKAAAEKALKTMQHSRLADHCLELKRFPAMINCLFTVLPRFMIVVLLSNPFIFLNHKVRESWKQGRQDGRKQSKHRKAKHQAPRQEHPLPGFYKH